MRKRQNGECNIRNFKRFLFGMSPDIPAFKVRFLQVTLNFELEVNYYISSRYSNSNFAHSFDIHRPTNIAKSINFSRMVSLWFALSCKCSIDTLKSDQWIPIWYAKFCLEYPLLIFIYFNSKFKFTCKNRDFECRYNRTYSEKKEEEKTPYRISNITFAMLPFSIPSWVLWSQFSLTRPSDLLQNGSF